MLYHYDDGGGFELDGLHNIFKGLQGMCAIVVCHERKYNMRQEFFYLGNSIRTWA